MELVMISQIRRPVYSFIGITLVSLSLSGCIIHVNAKSKDWDNDSTSYMEDLKSTNKSVNVGEGRTVENVGSVNGSVVIKDNVTAKRVTNTNGSITIGDNVKVESVEAVNGGIKIGEGFVSEEDVSTVNGQIAIQEKSQIGGELSTVNGSVSINGVVVEKDIVTVNGSIKLKDGSLVKGDIHFRGNSKNNYYKNYPVLYISADSNVEGDIILERPVELELENKSLESKVKRLYKDE
jgi:UDP-3-O-[3-hydroxymyristoyl] glucosamine N-acyltransferase